MPKKKQDPDSAAYAAGYQAGYRAGKKAGPPPPPSHHIPKERMERLVVEWMLAKREELRANLEDVQRRLAALDAKENLMAMGFVFPVVPTRGREYKEGGQPS